ncbi:adenylate/guanylate cyclase domain-containing protein [Tistrella mobilis]|uniref:adenylate/guanylate cyclase domain-containing protein n=1 Tax=Tistrella mobilis TaxID=171437 RepID=UPI00355655FD
MAPPPSDGIDAAERAAERLGGWLRIAIAAVLLCSLVGPLLILQPAMIFSGAVSTRLVIALTTLIAFGLAGGAGVLLARRGRYRRWMAWVFPAVDAGLLCASVLAGLVLTALPGDYALMLTAVWLAPVILAIAALRLRAGAILIATAMTVAALGLPMLADGTVAPDPAALADEINGMHAMPPNLARLVMLALAGGVLAFAARRNRRIVARAVDEAARAGRLGRFLPAEIAADVGRSGDDPAGLGGRRRLAMIFVDLRGSTMLAEKLDPQTVGRRIGDYRARVRRVVTAHGGLVAGFVGDGILVLFGATGPEAPDAGAAAALTAAGEVASEVSAWARETLAADGIGTALPDPAVAVAVHAGTVYCGPVGDDERLDYTVLGDPVNVAARIESIAKERGLAVVASDTVIDLAGRPAGWRSIGLCTLRGRSTGMTCHTPG